MVHQRSETELRVLANENTITPEQALAVSCRDVKPKPGHAIVIPVLLVDETTKKPVSEMLSLHLFEDFMPGGYVFPSWGMLETKLSDDFVATFQTARSAVNHLTRVEPPWPDDKPWGVRWEITGMRGKELTGTSLGGAIALGLLLVLRSANVLSVKHPLHRKLEGITRNSLDDKLISAAIDEDGRFRGVDGIIDEHGEGPKLRAAKGRKALLFVATPPQETHPDLYPVENLDDLLSSCRGMIYARPRPYKLWFWPTLTAGLALMVLAAWWHIFHPSDERLLQGLPSREAYFVAGQKNTAFSHVVTIRDFSEYNWMEKHRPTLAKLQNSFSLTIGEMNEFAGDRQAFSLRGFDSLHSVRAVHLLRSYIASLEGAENLENIIHFTNQGSAIQDLSWLTRCENLETLVLDSGFLQKYPRPMRWPRLQSLILHVPEHDVFVNLHGCQELRHLAICGEGIEFIEGLQTLEHLESVVLHTPNLKVTKKRNAFYPVNRIKCLTLVGCREFRELDLDAFPMLEELELGDILISAITGKQRAKLKELTIYQGHGIDHLDLSDYPSLVRLTLKHTPVREVQGFRKADKLEEVVMHDVETRKLKDIGEAPLLREVEIQNALELTAVNLEKARNLRSLKIKVSSLSQLDHLDEASSLQRMDILDSPIVDLGGLSELGHLEHINLSDTAVRGLPSLKKVPVKILILRNAMLEILPELSDTACSLNIEGTPVGKAQEMADLNWKQNQNGNWLFEKNNDSFDVFEPNYVRSLFDENGQQVDEDGWPYVEITPAPPSFSPNAMLKRWRLMGQAGIEGAFDYSGWGGWDHFEYVPAPTPVSPFKKAFERTRE